MNVLVCCKLVPDVEDVQVINGAIDTTKARWKISEYDRQAIQAGVDLAQETSGKVSVLNAGSQKCETASLKKDILSRGPEELYQIIDDSLQNADTVQICDALASAITEIGADVVICGESSADRGYSQVDSHLAATLGWAGVNSVNKISAKENSIEVERELDTEIETLSVPLPAVVSVNSAINKPSIPGMRSILAAGKKPQSVVAFKGLSDPTVIGISTEAPAEPDRKKILIEGDPVEAASKVVGLLKQDGIL